MRKTCTSALTAPISCLSCLNSLSSLNNCSSWWLSRAARLRITSAIRYAYQNKNTQLCRNSSWWLSRAATMERITLGFWMLWLVNQDRGAKQADIKTLKYSHCQRHIKLQSLKGLHLVTE